MRRYRAILSYGLGVDSSSIAVRWDREPGSMTINGVPFTWDDVIFLTAATGSEFPSTKKAVEAAIFPILRKHNVRFVEVARDKDRPSDIVVLQDTTQPETLNYRSTDALPYYTLADEMFESGCSPQLAGDHLCSIHTKGQPLDKWIAQNIDLDHAHGMGFNDDEHKRMRKGIATRASKGQAAPFFPLIEWGWDYDDARDYLKRETGIDWLKSCCGFCPMSGGCPATILRYRSEPEMAAEALVMETAALAINPRQGLYGNPLDPKNENKLVTLREKLEEDGNTTALAMADEHLRALPWARYEVRRVYFAKGKADRSVKRLKVGTHAELAHLPVETIMSREDVEILPMLDKDGDVVTKRDGTPKNGKYRRWVPESFIVSAPALALDKQRTSFEKTWAKALDVWAEDEIS